MTPRERFLALPAETRAQWLDPAEAEFCAHGYEAASLNRILATGGLSKGRSYHYFADKGALFRAVLERRLDHMGRLDTDKILKSQDAALFWEETASLCGGLAGAFQRDASLAALIRVLHRESAAKGAFARPLAVMRDQIAGLVTHGQGIGAVRSDLPASLLADLAFDLLVSIDRWFAGQTEVTGEDEAELSRRAFGLFVDAFVPPQG